MDLLKFSSWDNESSESSRKKGRHHLLPFVRFDRFVVPFADRQSGRHHGNARGTAPAQGAFCEHFAQA
jgi:hypothetical protein